MEDTLYHEPAKKQQHGAKSTRHPSQPKTSQAEWAAISKHTHSTPPSDHSASPPSLQAGIPSSNYQLTVKSVADHQLAQAVKSKARNTADQGCT